MEFLRMSLFIDTNKAANIKHIPAKISWFKGAKIWYWSKPSEDTKINRTAVNANAGSPSSTGLILPNLKTPVEYWFHRAEKNVAIIKINTTGIIMLKFFSLIISRNCNVSMNETNESTPWSKSIPNGLPVPFLWSKCTCLSCLFSVQVVHVLVNKDRDGHHHKFPCCHTIWVLSTEHEQQMDKRHHDKWWKRDEVWSNPFRYKIEKPFSQGTPNVFVSNGVAASIVLELKEQSLVWIRMEVLAGSIYLRLSLNMFGKKCDQQKIK